MGKWDELENTVHNFLFLLVAKCLQDIGKGLAPIIKTHIKHLVQTRNNLSHDDIQDIRNMRRNVYSKITLDVNIVKQEITEMANLYTDLFNEIRGFLLVHGKPSPDDQKKKKKKKKKSTCVDTTA